MSPEQLAEIFGTDTTGDERQRAQASQRLFVRSQDQLATARLGASGRWMTAIEALDAYGIEKLLECIERSAAILVSSPEEPAATFRSRRQELGLTTAVIARVTKLAEEAISAAERPDTRLPIRSLVKLAVALGLDDRLIGLPGAGGKHQLATRLRSLSDAKPAFTPTVVTTFTEAAWVIRTQTRLSNMLGKRAPVEFTPDVNYGDNGYKPWQHGYFLANKTRQALELGEKPIESLRALCTRLGIPVVLSTLPSSIAGATIDSGEGRGILVNTQGFNQNVWIRRSTIAHELGHLLWDPTDRLQFIRVDDYGEIGSAWSTQDRVEARANAFAIQLLAPADALLRTFESESTSVLGLRRAMDKFGISFTAAKHHIRNAQGTNNDSLGPLTSLQTEPSDEWRGRESFTDDYFPIPETSQMRRGEFAGVVVAAKRANFISEDTAAVYLQTSPSTLRDNEESIAEIFELGK